MNRATYDREMQLHAVRGLAASLPSIRPDESEESREFTSQLRHVLEIYEWELEQDVCRTAPPTEAWSNIVCATSMLALLLKDEFLEINPELADYLPTDEPITIDEMILRLLSDAIEHFEKCGKSEALAPISDLVQRIGNAPAA